MGSLEPLISAIFCALFGTSGFMVTLGTAFVGWLVMLAVFVWARDAHSPAAGLAAMAWCMIGPSSFVHYQISPRGGYTVTILFSALILWLVSKLIADERKDSLVEKGKWLILGLLAGLGWWSNQLIVSTILTAALMAVVFLRRKIISLNTLSAAIGFFTGSLPFWWWNYLHDWQSFEFAGSLGQTPFLRGLKVFFFERFSNLFDLNHGAFLWRIAGTAIYVGAVVFFIYFLWKAVKTRHDKKRVYLLTVLVFILVSALVFSTSHFALMNTSRYLLPLVPAIAVIFGVLTAELTKKKFFYLGMVPLVVVIANQTVNLSWLAERGAGEKKYQHQIEECGKLLLSQDIYACYAPYGKHSWNFALNEKICFCNLPHDRYLPYDRRAELANKIAVFDNLGDINNFILYYGGSAKENYSGATLVCWDFTPPNEGLAAISCNSIKSIRDSLERDILTGITDGNIDTGWIGALTKDDDEWLEIDFKTPQTVRMIRLLYTEYPANWQVTGQREDGSWKNLTACVQTTGYLWSGPRPYWNFMQEGYRLECRIPPEKLKQLRIHHIQSGYKLLEIQLFSPAAEPEDEVLSLKNLTDLIHERNLNRIYCDRWPANAIFRETLGAVKTWLNPTVFKDCSLASDNGLWFTPRTALLVHEEDAALCQRTLSRRLVEMRQTKIGPWILFDFEPGKWKTEYGCNFELQWAGFACLARNNKHWAAELVRRSDILIAKGEPGQAVTLLQKACEAWPLYPPALKRLSKITAGQELVQKNKYWIKEYKKTQPKIRTEIKFSNGPEFAGVCLSTNVVQAGDAFTIQYYWKYPEVGVKGRPCVFVHFLNGDNILQDDHPLEQFKGADYQPYPEYFIETRRLVLPKTAWAGEYKIKIGLYDPSRKDLKRFKAQTDLPSRINSVELPIRLNVIKKK